MEERGRFAATFDDPRVSRQFCRRFEDDDRAVVVLGVVHDHPASVARVETVLERVDPDVLALELPPAAVPLYRSYAVDVDRPDGPRFGGEMSTAIACAPAATVEGIDASPGAFSRRLLGGVVTGSIRPTTAGTVLSGVATATKSALACRLAATVTDATSMTVVSDEPYPYGCSREDPPIRQADHERRHVATVRTLLSGTQDGPTRVRDEIRESVMCDRLAGCLDRGVVGVVVGVDHLEAIADRIRTR